MQLKINDNTKKDMLTTLQELLRFESVKAPEHDMYPFGENLAKTLDYFLSKGDSMGFTSKNIDNYAGHVEWKGAKNTLGILCHLDVVPAGDGWEYPPFDGTLVDNMLYGRGALDNKGPAVAALYAMKLLKDQGFQPKKTIRLILGTDEESGSACLKYYLKKEKKPKVAFSPDANFPVIHGEMGIVVCELTKNFDFTCDDGGIRILAIKGGTAPNMVPDMAYADLKSPFPLDDIITAYTAANDTHLSTSTENGITRVYCYGVSAHGSTPDKGINAIQKLLAFLNILDLSLDDATDYLRFIWTRFLLETNGKTFGIYSDDAYNKLVCNMGTIDFDASKGSVTLNIRYPVTSNVYKLKKQLNSGIRSHQISISKWVHQKPLFYKPTHPLVQTLMSVYKAHTGDEKAKPLSIGGGTYARHLPNAVAFGALFPHSKDTMHQKDECLSVDDFIKMTEIFASAIYELSK